ncbi:MULTISPECIES: hypothetical protein [Acinetobacter]|uniref:Transcriptional regulator n=1 Tax=Acinetobacter pecorum TaxID=2762215 RepID=A0ABR8VTL0_9GAMM|nr:MULTISPECIES: hypothetical protein [Acinetobacter]MBD8008110.1 hypothetical protein [Acinetobacter pecorum]OAL82966.1 hypothetical protein AY607_00915 [Acinetobacter sp. SFA]OAL84982.1 hypothetical protein AY605_04910 [Acinetobacter sp. SFD]
MSNQQEKKLFAERLNKALLEAKHPISPTYLANEFNNRYNGQPISVQSANNWLLGKAIPNQDKLAILALWLNVSNQWLRFGDIDQINTPNSNSLESMDLDFLLKFRRLSNSQKKLVTSLIDEILR